MYWVDVMEAVILAGGFGTRLKAVIGNLPKALAPVSGRPFLEYLMDSLIKKGFNRTIISVGYQAEKIIYHFGHNYNGIHIDYVQEKVPLGTGGAIKIALAELRGAEGFVLNGDSFLDIDFQAIIQQRNINKRPIIVAKNLKNAERYGNLKVTKNNLVGFLPKGTKGAGLINAGCYYLKKKQLEGLPLGAQFSFEKDYLLPYAKQHLFDVYIAAGDFIDIGTPSDYLRAQRFFEQGRH